MVGNVRKQKESDSKEQNKSKKSPKTSACENNPKDCYPPDGFLIDQKFGIQLVVLLISVPIVNVLMKSDNVEKYIETVERKVDSRQEKFSELYKKFTVAENKLSELEKLLHEDHFTRLLHKEWEKRKVLLAKEFEKKHTILNDTVDNELKNFYEKIRDVFQQINIHKKDYDDKLKERDFKLEEDIKSVTQKLKNNHSDLKKMVENMEHTLVEVNEQMNSFSVDMCSVRKTIEEVKGKQSEMETKIKSDENTLKTVNERVHRFSNETKLLRKETERLDVNSSKLNRKMKSNEKKIIEINRQLYYNSKKVNDQIKHLENNTEERLDEVDGMFNVTNERLDGVDGMFNVTNERLDGVDGMFNVTNERLDGVDGMFNVTNERLDGVDGMLNVTNERLDGVDGMFNVTNERLDGVDGMFNVTNERLDGVDKLFSVINADLYDISLYIVVLLFAVGFAVFLAAYEKLVSKQLRTVDSAAPAEVTNGHMLKSGPNKRLKKEDTSIIQFSSALIEILSQKNKEKGIGMISFSSSTQENHKRSFEAIDIPSYLPAQACVILKLDDLMLVQPYTKMVIFVDFNERNIILENSETEIGDIRRRTTEVLLEVGCDVFVVYYRDKNSKSLPKENLYNTKLYSIEKQTVLSRLRSKGRVFSVYDTFHPQQVQMLKSCLK